MLLPVYVYVCMYVYVYACIRFEGVLIKVDGGKEGEGKTPEY